MSIDTPHTLITDVVVTGDKFLAGINDTGDHRKSVTRLIASVNINLSPVFLTPLNNLSLVSLTPVINIHSRISSRIFKKTRNGPKGVLMGPGDTDS